MNLPISLQVKDFVQRLHFSPSEMQSYLLTEAQQREWVDLRSMIMIEVDGQPVQIREPRFLPTCDPDFTRNGVTEVDIANTLLLELPFDIFWESIIDSFALISLLKRAKAQARPFDDNLFDEIAGFAHEYWRKRNAYRKDTHDLVNVPWNSVDEKTHDYNIKRVQIAVEYIQTWVGYLGTMGNYEDPRFTLIKLMEKLGISKRRNYNPQVRPGTWSPDLMAVEEAVKPLLREQIYFWGNPDDRGETVSAYTLLETGMRALYPHDQTVVIYDRRNLPPRARKQYDASLYQIRRNTSIPVFIIEEGVVDDTPILEEVAEYSMKLLTA